MFMKEACAPLQQSHLTFISHDAKRISFSEMFQTVAGIVIISKLISNRRPCNDLVELKFLEKTSFLNHCN